MSAIPYPDGFDCIWIASDRHRHLGAFFTAGEGPMPVAILEGEPSLFETLERCLQQLPIISQARLLVPMPRPDDFFSLAERGLFVYDWSDFHRTKRAEKGTYEAVAIPSAPIIANALPSELEQWVETLNIQGLAFSDSSVVDIRAHFRCAESWRHGGSG